jgi:hypothetical protein
MIALSLRQPWCAACVYSNGNALGPKGIENRVWSPQSKGRRPPFDVLLHAAQGMTKVEHREAIAWMLRSGLRPPSKEQLELGGLVGVTTVADVIAPIESEYDQKQGIKIANRNGVDIRWHMTGQYGFVLKGTRRKPFLAWKGNTGFFEIPDEVAERFLAEPTMEDP